MVRSLAALTKNGPRIFIFCSELLILGPHFKSIVVASAVGLKVAENVFSDKNALKKRLTQCEKLGIFPTVPACRTWHCFSIRARGASAKLSPVLAVPLRKPLPPLPAQPFDYSLLFIDFPKVPSPETGHSGSFIWPKAISLLSSGRPITLRLL